jgi:hypothetical protein
MILGEGAAVCCLELGKKEKMRWLSLEGISYATEVLGYIYFYRSNLFQNP